jgi:1,3-beta-galactosyl-N-acetylhexosamine phosphorylase
VISVDPYQPEVYRHLMDYYDRWLAANPHTNVVRLTTLAFHFTVEFDGQARQKFRDWCSYTSDCVSPRALDDFAAEYGYALTAEDFVDAGQYNHLSRVPSERYLDWMAFVRRFVIRFGKDLVDRTHAAGKKAAFFWGDHWVGAEPFGDDFGRMGLDVAIGACEDGVALRRAADVPHPLQKEIRLYPYFFPDVFHKGGHPLEESRGNWIRIRRALLRKGVDRIGYGGYLSLALEFPEFIAHIRDLADEFRTILANFKGSESYKLPAKVAVLSAWGKIRSWMPTSDAAEKFTEQRGDVAYIQGSNLLECLSGLPFEVEFLSFDDIAASGIPRDVKVIINDGQALSSWSGGKHWLDPRIVAALKSWVHAGGGFIGVREPSAIWHQGRFFQMGDVLGVEKESGQSLGYPRRGEPAGGAATVRAAVPASHFILRDQVGGYLPTSERSFVWPIAADVRVLAESDGGHVAASAHSFGRGRGVYLAGLPFSFENCRLLHRAILWAAGQESAERTWFSSNPCIEVAAYPDAGSFVVINNSEQRQGSTIWQDAGRSAEVSLDGYKSVWAGL